MNRRPPTNRRNAFTLIELLLAVCIFAIVLGAMNTVFFSALRLRNRTVAAFETALPLQHTLSFIQKDIEGILPPGGRMAGPFTTGAQSSTNNTTFIGERVTPDIYTTSGNVGELARWADVLKVAYFLAVPTNTTERARGKDLVRAVTRNLLPVNAEEQELQYLMNGVEEVRLQYYDGMTWVETWDSNTSTNLPRAVKVQISLTEDYNGTRQIPAPVELVIPILVEAASTNSTQEAGGNQ